MQTDDTFPPERSRPSEAAGGSLAKLLDSLRAFAAKDDHHDYPARDLEQYHFLTRQNARDLLASMDDTWTKYVIARERLKALEPEPNVTHDDADTLLSSLADFYIGASNSSTFKLLRKYVAQQRAKE